MALLFAPPFFRATDIAGAPIPGAFLGFYSTGTSTLAPIWSDVNLSIPLANPLPSDANGWFPAIWLDDTLTYKFVLYSPDANTPTIPGAVLRTGDPYNATNSVGATAAETAAGVVITTLSYPVLNPFRYGADGLGGAADATALAAVQAVLAQTSGLSDWRNGMAVAGFPQSAAEVTAIVADPTIQILNYGADAANALRHYSGTGDLAKAINDTLTCNGMAYLDYPGTYPIDTMVTVGQNQELRLGKNVILQRQSARTAATTPLIFLKGLYPRFAGGTVNSQNDAPGGIVCCGHLDTSTSNYNAEWWRLEDTDIIGKDYLGTQTPLTITAITKANPGVVTVSGTPPVNGTMVSIRSAAGMTQVNFNTYLVAGVSGSTFQLTGNGLTSSGNIDTSGFGTYTGSGQLYLYPTEGKSIGVYAPSSQPVLGSNVCTNFYGKVTNVHVQTATTPFWLTDISNGHQLTNISFNGTYWNGLVLQGSYGNRVTMGFGDSAYQNGVIAIYLRIQGNPGALHASSLGSSRNIIDAANFELGTTGNFGVFVSQSDSKQTNNLVRFRWNSTGTAITDAAGANDIQVDTVPTVFQYGVTTGGAVILGAATPSTGVGASQLGFGTSTQTTVGAAGAGSALPATPTKYLLVNIAGTQWAVPVYAKT